MKCQGCLETYTIINAGFETSPLCNTCRSGIMESKNKNQIALLMTKQYEVLNAYAIRIYCNEDVIFQQLIAAQNQIYALELLQNMIKVPEGFERKILTIATVYTGIYLCPCGVVTESKLNRHIGRMKGGEASNIVPFRPLNDLDNLN